LFLSSTDLCGDYETFIKLVSSSKGGCRVYKHYKPPTVPLSQYISELPCLPIPSNVITLQMKHVIMRDIVPALRPRDKAVKKF